LIICTWICLATPRRASHQAATVRTWTFGWSTSGLTRSTQAEQTRNSVRSSSALMESTELAEMACWMVD